MELTKEICIERAKKYKYLGIFKAKAKFCYNFMEQNNFISELFDLGIFTQAIPDSFWTKELCQKEAIKYHSMAQWVKGSFTSHRIAKDQGWITDLSGHMLKRIRWTKESCLENALKFNSIKKWSSSKGSSYNTCCKKGWIPEMTSHMSRELKPSGYWNKERCLEEAMKYKSKAEWRNNSATSYRAALSKGWKTEIWETVKSLVLDTKNNIQWNKDLCMKEALKYDTKSNWQRGSGSSYQFARKNKWQSEMCSHMLTTSEVVSKVRLKWTKEEVLKEALKYDQISKWQKKSPGSYRSASNFGWVEEVSSHMIKEFFWDKESVLLDAKKYKRKSIWNKHSGGAYSFATRYGFFEEAVAHMHHWRTKEECKQDALRYRSREQWARLSPGPYWSAQSKPGWVDYACEHMPDHVNCDLREKRAVTRLINIIKKEITTEVEREAHLGTGFPDLTLIINNKVVIVEAKHDESRWHKKSIQAQMDKYEIDAKEKYKERFHSCILTSPKGKYGLDFKTLIKVLKGIK